MTLPMAISEVCRRSEEFLKEHTNCNDRKFIRACTVCMAAGVRKAATHVATAQDGLQWFECGEHGPNDHFFPRVSLDSLQKLFP
jgi:hypothetical protein